MLDPIYPKRVKWHQVDWRTQYKRALDKNYFVAMKVWSEVNMEKSREFRYEQTNLRIGNMATASTRERLSFLRLMKRWYEQRINNSGHYDAIKRRQATVEECKLRGMHITFPPFMQCPPRRPSKESCRSDDGRDMVKTDYSTMPEYRRLICRLGYCL